MKIIIKETFKDDFTTRPAGERLRKMIIESEEGHICLDFINLKIASASFFDEGIAKLFSEEGWSQVKIMNKIKFENLFSKDKELLIKVCSFRNLKLEV